MTSSDELLPEYSAPPVVEVVCGVQFEPLASFQSVHFGEFWRQIRDDYPRTEDKPPLINVSDDAGQIKPEFLTSDTPPLRRVFYIASDGSFLLQVQPSRFLCNWRRQERADSYPRFHATFDRFAKGWRSFRSFLHDSELGIPATSLYELTYINHFSEPAEGFPIGIQRYMPVFEWKRAQSVNFLPAPNGAVLALQFVLPEKRGSLRVSVNHGHRREDGRGVLIVELTARGQASPDWSDLNAWFSTAHEWIVRGFTDLTSPEAHQEWGRQR